MVPSAPAAADDDVHEAGLLRHPLTYSPAVAATATELRRLLPSGPYRPAVHGRSC